MRKHGLAHCCHHDIHWEYCYDYDERVNFIKEYKPQEEQELRLKLFQIVPDNLLPGRDSAEWLAYGKAGIAYGKAGIAYDKAWAVCEKAKAVCDKAKATRVKAKAACEKAWAVCVKARVAYGKAWIAHGEARDAFGKAYQSELDDLHDKLFPDCTWNGKTIFPVEMSFQFKEG